MKYFLGVVIFYISGRVIVEITLQILYLISLIPKKNINIPHKKIKDCQYVYSCRDCFKTKNIIGDSESDLIVCEHCNTYLIYDGLKLID